MFTGIVEEQGSILDVRHAADSATLRVRGPLVTEDVSIGDSVSVNGVCLTLTAITGDSFEVDVMAETLRRSSLADVSAGTVVNLERAMPATGRFGGHVVQGHVDATGTILRRDPGDAWEVVTVSLPRELRRYVVEKGSITVDGVSLTVSAISPIGADEPWFQVSLIPTTLRDTTLGRRAVAEVVNLEVDVLAKYVEAQLAERTVLA